MVEWILKPDKKVSQGMAIAILIINILIAGVGTMIYGRVLRGVVELLTSWLIIGWVFGIIDGVKILTEGTTTAKGATA
jgi:TM2 domain-containing membrane protein YozV